MMYDKEEGKYVIIPKNNIIDAIHFVWNYEYDLYNRSKVLLFCPFEDNEWNNENFKECGYKIEIVNQNGKRRIRDNSGIIHKAPWEN